MHEIWRTALPKRKRKTTCCSQSKFAMWITRSTQTRRKIILENTKRCTELPGEPDATYWITESQYNVLKIWARRRRFSEASQKLLKDMDQTEIFELFENTTKLQCPECNSFADIVIIYCSCERNLKYNRSPTLFQKDNLDCKAIAGYIIKKNSSRGPEHGQSERQIMFFKAKDMLRKAKKKNYPTILSRWKAQ